MGAADGEAPHPAPTRADPSPERASGQSGAGLDLDPVVGALGWTVNRLLEVIPAPDEEPPNKGQEFEYPPSASYQDVLYRYWCEARMRTRHERPDDDAGPTAGPIVSVVVPVYRPDLSFFERCVASVQGQTYRSWELCLCDDGSRSPDLTSTMAEMAAADPRIKVTSLARNEGISAATNRALTLASAPWVGFLDHDDELAPEALSAVARAIGSSTEVDVVYSDEDMIDVDGRLHRPHFKPDWAPDMLMSYPYVGHLMVVRRALVDQVGALRSEFDGSQDYDLMLRATERARRVVHVPEVLYHWRSHPGSAAHAEDAKPWAHDASRRVVEDAMARRRIEGWVESGPFPGAYHVRRHVRERPRVAIVIPFRDQPALTARCLSSLRRDPGYENYDIVMVDNGSTEPETRVLCSRWRNEGITVLEDRRPFSWSAINNLAASTCDQEVLLFVNNDVEAKAPGWLLAMMEHALRPEVGVVGARLLFDDGTLQHAGVVLGIAGAGAHLFRGLPPGETAYFKWDQMVRPYSAVTGACMATRRELFLEMGGFDEELLVGYNDLDYCMRVGNAGYRVIYTPHTEMVHHETATRGTSGSARDFYVFVEKWGRARLLDDPMYNPNLTLRSVGCGLRLPEEQAWWEEHTRWWERKGREALAHEQRLAPDLATART